MIRFIPSGNGGWWCSGCGSAVVRIGMVYACLCSSGCYGLYDEPLVTRVYAPIPACVAHDVDAGTEHVEPTDVGQVEGDELR